MLFAVLSFLLLTPRQIDASQVAQSEIPSVLRQAYEQRQKFATASWELREETIRNEFAPIVSNKVMKWAGHSFFCRDEGSDDGMIRYLNARTGEMPFGIASSFCPEERVLDNKSGSLWVRSINSPFTTLTSKEAMLDFVDPRTLGLRSWPIQRMNPKEMVDLLGDPDGLRFQLPFDRDGLTFVVGRGSPSGSGSYYEYEWVIDRSKGPSILISRQFICTKSGSRDLESEARCTLGKFEGRWWPIRVEFDHLPDNGRSVFEFRNIEFDLPHHPKEINADLLGLPIGAPIYPQGQRRTDRYMGAGVTIDDDTWKKIRNGYDRTPYREFSQRAVALGRGQFPSWWTSADGTEGISEVTDNPDLWEAYVRRWVMRRSNHGFWHVIEPLSDTQRTTAKGILDACRNKAVPIRMRLLKEVRAIAAELAAAESALTAFQLAKDKTVKNEASLPEAKKTALDTGTKKEKAASEQELKDKIKALQRRKTDLAKSPEIERIFDELKARLEGMLTTKQKDPANASFQRPTPPPPPRHSSIHRPKPGVTPAIPNQDKP